MSSKCTDTSLMLHEAEERGAFSDRHNHNWPFQKNRCAVVMLEGGLAGMHASVWKVEGNEVSIHLWNSCGKPVKHVVDVSQVRILDAEEAKAARRALNVANAKVSPVAPGDVSTGPLVRGPGQKNWRVL